MTEMRTVPGLKMALASYDLARASSLEDLVGMAGRLGFEGLELRTELGHAHGVETGLSSDRRRAVRHVVEDAYLDVACLTTSLRFDSPDACTRAVAVDGAKRHIELAADIGALAIRVCGNNLIEGVSREESISFVAESLRDLGVFAAQHGVDVLFEMHGDYRNWRHARRVMELADSERVGLMYNSDARSDVIGGSVRHVLERVRPWLRYVQLHDLTSGFPYRELLLWLRGAGFDGYVSPELWDFGVGDANGDVVRRGDGAFPSKEDYLALYAAHARRLSG